VGHRSVARGREAFLEAEVLLHASILAIILITDSSPKSRLRRTQTIVRPELQPRMTTTTFPSDAERPVEQAADLPVAEPSPLPPLPPRLRWRVVVRTGEKGKIDPSRPSRPLAWHLVSCTDNDSPVAHCPVGQRLLESGDDPDGHCLLDGVCPRCDLQK